MSEPGAAVHNVVLEKADANMEEATIGGWRVAEGDAVAEGDPLVELVTDKVTFDFASPVGGTVLRLAAAPGSVVPVGYVMAQIGDPGTEPPDVEAHNRSLIEEHRRRQEVRIESAPTARPADGVAGGRVRATPAARRLARQEGLDLAQVPPSDPGGIVSEEDVQRHLDAR